MINGHVIERVHHYNYLGVVIDEHLTWRAHVDYVCGRAYQRLCLLRLSNHILSRHDKIIFFKSLVRPILEYSSVAWMNCGKSVLKKLKLVEGYAARIITNSPRWTRTLSYLHL